MATKKKIDPGSSGAQRDRKKSSASTAVKAVQPMIATLLSEHRHLASVMELFKEQLNAIEQGQLVDTHVVYEIMDYIVRWPDRYHHPREDLIYGRVAEIDANAADNVDSLQREHDAMAKQSRAVLSDIERWRRGATNGHAVVESGRAYIERTYTHMNSEEKLVFPQIEAVLTASDWRELEIDDQLQPVTDPVFGSRVDREFRNMARKLRSKLRHGVERGAMIEWVGIEAVMESLEVLSMAYDSTRSATGDQIKAVLTDTEKTVRTHPLTSPWRCAYRNTSLTVDWLRNVADISKDTYQDLSRVNQARKDRVRLVTEN